MEIDKKDEIGSPNRYILENETYAIIGSAMEVYYMLGNGFAEPVYQEALGIEFELRDVVFEPQKRLHIEYKGRTLEKGYIADFLCFDQIIVEIKAVASLSPVDWSQIMNLLESERAASRLAFQFWQPWKNGNEADRYLIALLYDGPFAATTGTRSKFLAGKPQSKRNRKEEDDWTFLAKGFNRKCNHI